MKSLLIAGNWKSNKTVAEAKAWLAQFNAASERMSIVLFVPFTVLSDIRKEIQARNLSLVLGVQDVSPYPEGAYTGEESARMVKELADWVLVGHSERRTHFHESDAELASEVRQAKSAGLSVMYCVSDEEMKVPAGVDAIAYEPTWAIGTGKTETPQHAGEILQKLTQRNGIGYGLYGGSVTAQNVGQFISQPGVTGVLVGGASLDPRSFADIVKEASSLS